MTVEKIRELLHAVPFERFVVRTPDGLTFEVPHPDFAMLSGTGRLLRIARLNTDAEDVVDIALITSVELTAPSKPQ